MAERSIRGQLRTLPSRKSRSRIDRMPRILPSGMADRKAVQGQVGVFRMQVPPSSIRETSGLRGLGRACIPTRRGRYRRGARGRSGLRGQKAPFESDHCGAGICHPFSFTIPHLNLKLSRLSWSTDRQPISFMSRSISARRFSSALSTPA